MPQLRIDMTGKKVERLTFIRPESDYVSPVSGKKKVRWLVRCDCGTEKIVILTHVLNGPFRVISCGCLGKEKRGTSAVVRCTKHGESRRRKFTREYNIYRGAKERCNNANHKSYKNYGGRGISVCERWSNDFSAFLEDMGRCPPGLTIERKDNDGNYEPGNCKWATAREQRLNQRPRR